MPSVSASLFFPSSLKRYEGKKGTLLDFKMRELIENISGEFSRGGELLENGEALKVRSKILKCEN